MFRFFHFRWRLFSLLLLSLIFSVSVGSAQVYRVMTWNLMDMDLFDGAGLERVLWQVNAEKGIAETIRSVGPDILFITEAPSFTELEGFVDRNNLDYHIVHLRQQAGRRDYADSMALLTRGRVQEASLETPFVPGSNRAPESAYLDWSFRGLVVAVYGDLTIVGTHLKSPWDGKKRSYDIRNAQAQGLMNYIRTIEDPLLVLGDFNDSPGRDDKERTFGVPDTLSIIEKNLVRSPGDEVTQKKGFNLDHIFVRGGRVEYRRIVETDWILSDHRPVWTNVEFY